MLIAALAAALMTAVTSGVEPLPHGEALLANPRPWPAGRVDSPARAENGRLWISRSPIGNRTPLAEQGSGRIGPAAFGAPADLADAVVNTRILHLITPVSPWRTFDKNGFRRYREAQNIWLRQQGWVLKVRTHINPRYQNAQTADAGAILPRATIEIHRDPSAPHFPSRMRVRLDGARIFKPMIARASGVIHVIEPAENTPIVAQASTNANDR